MTAQSADFGPPQFPPMRTMGGLRTALTMSHGFPADADGFAAELAREIDHADPDGLNGVARPAEEFRGRIVARQDLGFDSSVAAAVAGIRAARGTAR
ncbi:hypothetical protein [Streptomyces hirsutus]|uniref:hypothetical protein n=1 Tax=Streptomyces hirsutus TaxID=35620 RepID=UPI0006E3C736|nr:hypothetical protein [Streptomyces hirsutus]